MTIMELRKIHEHLGNKQNCLYHTRQVQEIVKIRRFCYDKNINTTSSNLWNAEEL